MCWAGAGRGGGGQVSSISSIGPGKGEEIGVMCPGVWPPPGRLLVGDQWRASHQFITGHFLSVSPPDSKYRSYLNCIYWKIIILKRFSVDTMN